jgi:O-antigen/teichoic acid export membrane protein
LSDNSKIIKNSGILYVRLIITSIVGLISTRLLLQALGVSDFGLYNVVGSIVVMMGFLNTVMISTTYRYIAFEMGKGNLDGINQVFNISLVIHFCLGILLVLFAETIGSFYIHNYLEVPADQINDAYFVFRFSIWGTVFTIISIPYQGLITAQEKFFVRASLEIIGSVLRLGAVLLVVSYLGNRLKLYSILMMIVMIIPAILYYYYSKKEYATFIRFKFQKDWDKYKEMLGFSGWIMIGAGAHVGKSQGAALIINSFFGTVLNATFGIANQVSMIISMFSKNLSQAAIPQIIKNYGGNNTVRSTELTLYISKYSFFLMLLPALPILLETDYILKLWLVDIPVYTTIFIKLFIIYALIESLNSGIPAIIQASGKIKWFQLINSTILLLSLPVAYFLFRLGLPPYYITIVFISAIILTTLITLVLLKKIISFNIRELIHKVYFRVILVTLLLMPLLYIRNLIAESFGRLVIISILSVVLYFIVIYFVGLEKVERKAVIAIVIKLKKSKDK